MSGTYWHFIEPGRKETRGSDIYSPARRLLAKGTIHPETRLETWRLAVTQDLASGRPKPGFKVQWHLRQI
jgi:hypothetical protein